MKRNIPTHPRHPAGARAAWKLAPAAACCGALALLSGCATEPESHVLSAPPPPPPTRMVTTTTTTSAPVAVAVPVTVGNTTYTTTQMAVPTVNTVVVTQAPPALQSEVVLAQPSSMHVWIAGYWTWHNDQYQWMAGHWELPPGQNSAWIGPRWEQEGNAYRFHEGYWQ